MFLFLNTCHSQVFHQIMQAQCFHSSLVYWLTCGCEIHSIDILLTKTLNVIKNHRFRVKFCYMYRHQCSTGGTNSHLNLDLDFGRAILTQHVLIWAIPLSLWLHIWDHFPALKKFFFTSFPTILISIHLFINSGQLLCPSQRKASSHQDAASTLLDWVEDVLVCSIKSKWNTL